MRHRALKFHPFGWVLLAVGAIIYLAMPRVLFDTFMADQRLPISLAFMVIACAHLNLRHDYRAPRLCDRAGRCCWRSGCSKCRSVWSDLSRDHGFVPRIGPPHRARLQGAGRLCRSGRRRRRAGPRPRACRLPCHHRAVGAGDDRLHRRRQADPARARRLSRPRRHRRRHAADDRASCCRSPTTRMPRTSSYWSTWTVGLRLSLRAVHRRRITRIPIRRG